MSNNSTNVSLEVYSYMTMDEVLTLYGSTWALDYLNLYFYTIVSIVGFVLSMFSLVIFQDDEFSLPLYAYLRVYSINNILGSFINIFNFVYSSIRIFEWSNSHEAQVYYNYISMPIANVCYSYSGVLNNAITLDRMAYLSVRLKNLFTMSPNKVSAIAFVACFLLNLPYACAQRPRSHFCPNRTKRGLNLHAEKVLIAKNAHSEFESKEELLLNSKLVAREGETCGENREQKRD
jgi:hypothetical protein